ncbi:Peptidase M15A, C-terminal [uncultured Caudovirales phage]|uniref:Peptidase M15A, C-terminal n=1 Tax=uncultured Caudovirales phage TaxID=2100421 RepID=A0A6J7WYI7_9CAUD|nr:Peptidase M15A, C-terminal [uncultured Caudovirales phage]
MRLSPNFTLVELCRSSTATQHGINNIPSQNTVQGLAVIKALIAGAKAILEPIRKQYGRFSPSSGYRAPQVNRLVGSSDSSQHTLGEAFDVPPPLGVTLEEFATWCWKNLPYDQLIVERKKGEEWLHISHKANGKQRRQALQKTDNGPYLQWRPKA